LLFLGLGFREANLADGFLGAVMLARGEVVSGWELGVANNRTL